MSPFLVVFLLGGALAIGFLFGWSVARRLPADGGRGNSPFPAVAAPAASLRAAEAPAEPLGSVGYRLALQLERITEADVLVAVPDPQGPRLVGVSRGADRRLLDVTAAPDGPAARALERGATPAVVEEDPLGGVVADRRQAMRRALLLPIRDGGGPVGVAIVGLPAAGDLDPAVRAAVDEVLDGVAGALGAALQAERAGAAADVDPITGLGNRRALDAVLQRPGRRDGALIFVDLDRLSLLNRTLGQLAGDAALVHVARLLHEQIRGGDFAARVGPEEFAVWIPGAPVQLGVRVAERIRVKLGTTRWDWQGREWPLSASFGVAGVPETTRGREQLLQQAEAAMLVAKKGGRNRVEVAAAGR